MTHSDDDGLVLPPKLAPTHVVIVPIHRSEQDRARVLEYCNNVARELRAQRFGERAINVIVDDREERGGDKIWHWIKKGVPIRLEIGPRDIDKDALFVGRRDRAPKEKQSIARNEFVANIVTLLQAIQDGLFERARQFREQHTHLIDSKDDFYSFFTAPKVPENTPTPIHAGFALAHFSGDVKLEERIKDELGVTVRCIPLEKSEPGTCPFTGNPSPQRVVWAKAY
jgi:prolyl-tRNA synthetase